MVETVLQFSWNFAKIMLLRNKFTIWHFTAVIHKIQALLGTIDFSILSSSSSSNVTSWHPSAYIGSVNFYVSAITNCIHRCGSQAIFQEYCFYHLCTHQNCTCCEWRLLSLSSFHWHLAGYSNSALLSVGPRPNTQPHHESLSISCMGYWKHGMLEA